ncbi:hypothetical protein PFISCL1PPCAC_16949 [Pristionchus fissidentatus]|uniref:DUF38 domain-containing protein n=1 Tax=Pristionchus fissidentatus TaxID=1538716 RepID=A0AAV5W3T3_9BILA|nr:hypothetical protein PFISCL1PPCAC_16949 [Pristionchus fissidentatus]
MDVYVHGHVESFVKSVYLHHDSANKLCHLDSASQSVANFLQLLKRSFRRLQCETLSIYCDDLTVDTGMFGKLTSQFEFQSFTISFEKRFQHNIIDFARRSKRRIDCIAITYCSFEFHHIMDLPPVERLCLLGESGLDDDQVLEIAKLRHRTIKLYTLLSNPATLLRIIKSVRSSEFIERLEFFLSQDHFHFFLNSVNFRQQLGEEESLELIEWAQFESEPSEEMHYFYDDTAFLEVARGFTTYEVAIVNGQIPENYRPVHRLNLGT